MIEGIAAVEAIAAQAARPVATISGAGHAQNMSFDQILRASIETTNTKMVEADRMVAAFALDNDIPAHKVTFALEEARLSLELMIQVRNRMIEGYQQIMNMQI